MQPVPGGRVVDLGCGDGRLTLLAHERLGAGRTLGIDSSPAMLDRAPTADGVEFALGDIGPWTDDAVHDVVLANASLQWVPDH